MELGRVYQSSHLHVLTDWSSRGLAPVEGQGVRGMWYGGGGGADGSGQSGMVRDTNHQSFKHEGWPLGSPLLCFVIFSFAFVSWVMHHWVILLSFHMMIMII